MLVPRMLHGKVLRSPDRPRPHRLDRHVGGGEDAGRRLRPDRRRPAGHRPVLRARDQGPADHRDRQGALPRRAGGRRRRRDAAPPRPPPSRRSSSSTRSCRWSRTSRRRSPPGRRSSPTARRSRGSSTASESSPPRDGNVCYRYRIDRGELEAVFARADIVVEGEYTFPVRLPVRDGDAHGDRPGTRATRSRSGRPASTRSWCAPRSPTSSACRSRTCGSRCRTSAAASARSRTPRWSR